MRIQLVFHAWLDKEHKPIAYYSEEGFELSAGGFHAGSTFEARIEPDDEDAVTLRAALTEGYKPVFYAVAVDPDSWRTPIDESDQKGE